MKHPSPRHEHHQLQQLIGGLDDGIVLVAFDQTILSANSRAVAMHGVGDAGELGRTVGEYRRRFKLSYRNDDPVADGDFPIEKVLAGQAPRDILVEICPADSPGNPWTHSIRSIVIEDEAGQPDFIALIFNDETMRVEAEDRFESAFNANPAPALICRLSDLRFIRANRGFLDMTGYGHDEITGHSVYELDLLHDFERRGEALRQLKAWQTIPQGEASLHLPDGSRKCVILAGQPIEISDVRCMLFTFADLDPRRRAETALRHSEERFSKAFRLSPISAAICRLDDFRFLEVNDAFLHLTGHCSAEVLNRSPLELKLWDDPAVQARLDRSMDAQSRIPGFDVRLRRSDGAMVDCVLTAESITVEDEACVLCVLQDVTEKKQSESELVDAIERVMSETSWFSRSVVDKLAALRQPVRDAPPAAGMEKLTDREREILGLMCQGVRDAAMAERLHLSRHTIRNHVASLFRKLGVNRRDAAVIWAHERGITGPVRDSVVRPR